MNDLVAFLYDRLQSDKLRAETLQAIASALTLRGTPTESADYIGETGQQMLREVEAKRRIVDWVVGAQAAAGDPPGFDPADAAALSHALRLLALSYADHPDYREEWRP